MSTTTSRLSKVGLSIAFVGSIALAYWAGYRAGLEDKGPQHRALMVVKRTPGSESSVGTSATWFDISKPLDAARFRREQERLKAIGAEFYVAKGLLGTTLSPEPEARWVNSHR